MKQQGILVCGMHRSGTSCMAGSLSFCGVELNPGNRNNLNLSNWENPKGFYEHTTFVRIHKEALRSVGNEWHSDKRYDEINQMEYVDKLTEKLDDYFSEEKLFAIKDPRITILHDMYIAAFDNLDIELNIVRMNRHCEEVAMSLQKRNFFSIDKGKKLCRLYKNYANIFWNKLQPSNRIQIEFSKMVQSPVEQLQKVSKALEIDFVINQQEVKKFVEPKLRRHRL